MQKGLTLSQSKGFASILIITVVLLILIGGGVYLYQNLKPPTSLNSPNSPDSSNSNIPNFKDYLDQSLELSLKYSKDLTVKEDSEEEFNQRGNGDFRKNFTGYVGYEPGKVLGAVAVLGKDRNYDTNPVSVWAFDNPDNLIPDGWFDKYWYYPYLWGVFDRTSKGHVALDKEATISGQPAKYKIVSYQPGKPKFVYMSKDQKMYLLRVIGEAGDKILSSFKFLEYSSENKDYTCPKNGWENCMPILTPEAQKQCSQEALDWKKKNCSNFQGVAQ